MNEYEELLKTLRQRAQEIQHSLVEFPGLLHIQMVSRTGDDYFPGTGNAFLKDISNRENRAYILVANNNERRDVYLREARDGRWL